MTSTPEADAAAVDVATNPAPTTDTTAPDEQQQQQRAPPTLAEAPTAVVPPVWCTVDGHVRAFGAETALLQLNDSETAWCIAPLPWAARAPPASGPEGTAPLAAFSVTDARAVHVCAAPGTDSYLLTRMVRPPGTTTASPAAELANEVLLATARDGQHATVLRLMRFPLGHMVRSLAATLAQDGQSCVFALTEAADLSRHVWAARTRQHDDDAPAVADGGIAQHLPSGSTVLSLAASDTRSVLWALVFVPAPVPPPSAAEDEDKEAGSGGEEEGADGDAGPQAPAAASSQPAPAPARREFAGMVWLYCFAVRGTNPPEPLGRAPVYVPDGDARVPTMIAARGNLVVAWGGAAITCAGVDLPSGVALSAKGLPEEERPTGSVGLCGAAHTNLVVDSVIPQSPGSAIVWDGSQRLTIYEFDRTAFSPHQQHKPTEVPLRVQYVTLNALRIDELNREMPEAVADRRLSYVEYVTASAAAARALPPPVWRTLAEAEAPIPARGMALHAANGNIYFVPERAIGTSHEAPLYTDGPPCWAVIAPREAKTTLLDRMGRELVAGLLGDTDPELPYDAQRVALLHRASPGFARVCLGAHVLAGAAECIYACVASALGDTARPQTAEEAAARDAAVAGAWERVTRLNYAATTYDDGARGWACVPECTMDGKTAIVAPRGYDTRVGLWALLEPERANRRLHALCVVLGVGDGGDPLACEQTPVGISTLLAAAGVAIQLTLRVPPDVPLEQHRDSKLMLADFVTMWVRAIGSACSRSVGYTDISDLARSTAQATTHQVLSLLRATAPLTIAPFATPRGPSVFFVHHAGKDPMPVLEHIPTTRSELTQGDALRRLEAALHSALARELFAWPVSCVSETVPCHREMLLAFAEFMKALVAHTTAEYAQAVPESKNITAVMWRELKSTQARNVLAQITYPRVVRAARGVVWHPFLLKHLETLAESFQAVVVPMLCEIAQAATKRSGGAVPDTDAAAAAATSTAADAGVVNADASAAADDLRAYHINIAEAALSWSNATLARRAAAEIERRAAAIAAAKAQHREAAEAAVKAKEQAAGATAPVPRAPGRRRTTKASAAAPKPAATTSVAST